MEQSDLEVGINEAMQHASEFRDVNEFMSGLESVICAQDLKTCFESFPVGKDFDANGEFSIDESLMERLSSAGRKAEFFDVQFPQALRRAAIATYRKDGGTMEAAYLFVLGHLNS